MQQGSKVASINDLIAGSLTLNADNTRPLVGSYNGPALAFDYVWLQRAQIDYASSFGLVSAYMIFDEMYQWSHLWFSLVDFKMKP